MGRAEREPKNYLPSTHRRAAPTGSGKGSNSGVLKTDYGDPRLLAVTVGDDSGRADVLEGVFEQELADRGASCEVLIIKTKVGIHDRCLEHTVGQGSYPEVQTMDMEMDHSQLMVPVGAKPVRLVEDEERQRWILELWKGHCPKALYRHESEDVEDEDQALKNIFASG
eukprot:4624741-Amphidinium_carterae.1